MTREKRAEYALEIKYDETKNLIMVEALISARFTHYGFGTFLENVEPNEVRITQKALKVLLQVPERGGLQGMEFWADNRLAWGSLSLKFSVSPQDINVPQKAKQWIKQFSVV